MELYQDEYAEHFAKKVTILDAVHLIHQAHLKVTSDTIKNCFSNAFNPIPHGIWNNVSTWGGGHYGPP